MFRADNRTAFSFLFYARLIRSVLGRLTHSVDSVYFHVFISPFFSEVKSVAGGWKLHPSGDSPQSQEFSECGGIGCFYPDLNPQFGQTVITVPYTQFITKFP